MLRLVCCLVLVSFSLALGSCGGAIGLAVGAAGRAAGTGDEYAAWKSTMPPIPPGAGRVFFYIPGREFTLNAVTMASGQQRVFGIDKDVCGVVEDTFMYLDLPPGNHEISVGDMVGLKWLGKPFRKGKTIISVNVAAGGTTFVRLDPAGEDADLAPRIVDAATAEAEMMKLSLDKHFVSMECKKNIAVDRGV